MFLIDFGNTYLMVTIHTIYIYNKALAIFYSKIFPYSFFFTNSLPGSNCSLEIRRPLIFLPPYIVCPVIIMSLQDKIETICNNAN